MSDEARKKILARRAAFVAAALATVACGKDIGPQPCLSPTPQPPPDGGQLDVRTAVPPAASIDEPPPMPPHPCLSIRMPDPPDAGGPRPCLKIRAPDPDAGVPVAPPLPCLTPPAPKPTP